MKRFLLPILITLFVISASAVFTLNFRALYYHDISSLNIEEISGYSEHVIRENYNALIDYNSIFHRDPLDLSLPMSREGRIHFQDVKRIFDVLQIICLITLAASLILGIRSWKQGCRKFLRNSAILSVLLPAYDHRSDPGSKSLYGTYLPAAETSKKQFIQTLLLIIPGNRFPDPPRSSAALLHSNASDCQRQYLQSGIKWPDDGNLRKYAA